MKFNRKERHLLARSLFRFNSFLLEESKILERPQDEIELKKISETMQEVLALFEKLGLNDKDLYKLEND